MIAPALQNLGQIQLVGRQAGNPESALGTDATGLQMGYLPFQTEPYRLLIHFALVAQVFKLRADSCGVDLPVPASE